MHPSLTAKSNLDAAMCVLFSYVEAHCVEAEPAKENINGQIKTDNKEENMSLEFTTAANPQRLYRDLMKCFESQILPAHGTGHVQFLVFYLISRNPNFAEQFLKWLWAKFSSPNTPQILRQSAMAYIASFISRALCITRPILITWLKKVT